MSRPLDRRRRPTKLTHLHFFNNMCGDAGAKAAADVMRESPMLQDFRFSSCRAIEDGGKCMAEALSATTNLVRLEMSDGSFGEDAGVVLAKALATNPGVVHLDLSDIGTTTRPPRRRARRCLRRLTARHCPSCCRPRGRRRCRRMR